MRSKADETLVIVKYILFNFNKNITATCKHCLSFNNTNIERVQNISFLGIFLNEHLSWKPHMLTMLKKLRILVGMLFKLKYYLNNDNLIQI